MLCIRRYSGTFTSYYFITSVFSYLRVWYKFREIIPNTFRFFVFDWILQNYDYTRKCLTRLFKY